MMNNILHIILLGVVSAGEPAATEPSAECAAADIIRTAFPGWFNEEDLALLAAQACPALERWLRGESLVMENHEGAVAGVSVVQSGAPPTNPETAQPEAIEGLEAWGPDLPPSDTPYGDSAVKLMGTPRAAGDDSEEPGTAGWGVVPSAETVEVDAELAAMQEEYLKLGCADGVESEACENSRYVRYLQAELENAQTY